MRYISPCWRRIFSIACAFLCICAYGENAKPSLVRVENVDVRCQQLSGVQMQGTLSNSLAATRLPPGTPAGAGLAGVLIGGLLSTAINSQRLQEQNNAPIRPILEKLDKDRVQKQLAESLRRILADDLLNVAWRNSLSDISIQPLLTFEPSIARITLRISISSRLGDDDILERYETISPPVSGSQSERMDYWTRNDMENLYAQLDGMSGELGRLLSSYRVQAVSPSHHHTAIRYHDESDVYYERGIVLAIDEDRIDYQSLGGIVKSVLGTIEE